MSAACDVANWYNRAMPAEASQTNRDKLTKLNDEDDDDGGGLYTQTQTHGV